MPDITSLQPALPVSELSKHVAKQTQFPFKFLIDSYLGCDPKSSQHKLLSKFLSLQDFDPGQQQKLSLVVTESLTAHAVTNGLFSMIKFIHAAAAYRRSFTCEILIPRFLKIPWFLERVTECVRAGGYDEVQLGVSAAIAYQVLKNPALPTDKFDQILRNVIFLLV